MIVTPPIVVIPALLTSSTAAEPAAGETAWVSGTTYAIGDERILVATHRVYVRLLAGAGTITPDLDPTNWKDGRATNKWAMFDLNDSTKTVLASPLTVVVAPGQRINSIGLGGLEASSVQIVLAVGATTYYDQTVNLSLRDTQNWTDYLIGEFLFRESLVRFDLPPVTGATLTVILTGSTVKCEKFVIGRHVFMGTTVDFGASNDGLNFSVIERDPYGTLAKLVPRRTVPKTDQKVMVKKDNINKLLRLRKDLNAVVAMWSGLDDLDTDGYFDALFIIGIYKQFLIPLDYPDDTTVSLQLEEV